MPPKRVNAPAVRRLLCAQSHRNAASTLPIDLARAAAVYNRSTDPLKRPIAPHCTSLHPIVLRSAPMPLMSTPPESTPDTPLAGVVVLEFGARHAVAVAGSLLAQLGATVIYIEPHRAGDIAQTKWQHRPVTAAGKWSVALDRQSAPDRALITRLCDTAQIVLTSSDTDRLVFDGDLIGPLPPTTIHCDTTAFGRSGPLSGHAASDAEIQALCGMSDATGLSTGPPITVDLPLIEHLTGLHAAAAVLAAHTAPTGGPRTIELALYDVAFSAMTSFLPAAFGETRKTNLRVGNRHTLASPWNVYRARDGWVLVCAGNDEQWQRIGDVLGDPGRLLVHRYPSMGERVAHADVIDAAMQDWVALRSIATCVEAFSEAGIACGPVAPVDGYPREANLIHRGMVRELCVGAGGERVYAPGSALKMSRTPGQVADAVSAPDADRGRVLSWLSTRSNPARRGQRPRPPSAPTPGVPSSGGRTHRPLAGLRVLEIGHYTTAPAAARQLAAWGAEVIKLEPPGGEAVRRWPPMHQGRSVFFTFQNADKRSLVLDLSIADHIEQFKELIQSCDVLVENLRPGALARKGLDAQSLHAIQPRLIVCAISGFGLDSLYAGRPAFDTVVQAMSGMMDLIRDRGTPLKTGPSMADVMGATFAVAAIMGALAWRGRSGRGQFIDVAMQDVCAWATQTAWNRPPESAPQSAKPTAVLSMHDVARSGQVVARQLWQLAPAEDGSAHAVIRQPVIFDGQPGAVPRPARALGADTLAILGELVR